MQLEEERRSKEAAEASFKRTQEKRRKIEIDAQRSKDDIQRLEHELFCLKASAESTQPNCPSNAFGIGETNLRMLHDMQRQQELSQKEAKRGRKCLICRKDEVSVVLLPCAHQVLCVGCNEDHEKAAKTNCPSCGVQIEERIHVYGATSQFRSTGQIGGYVVLCHVSIRFKVDRRSQTSFFFCCYSHLDFLPCFFCTRYLGKVHLLCQLINNLLLMCLLLQHLLYLLRRYGKIGLHAFMLIFKRSRTQVKRCSLLQPWGCGFESCY